MRSLTPCRYDSFLYFVPLSPYSDNDSDPDEGDSLTICAGDGGVKNSEGETIPSNGKVTNLPEGGTLSIDADGCFTYSTADGAFESLEKGENATVCFTYSVCDTYGASDTAEVCIDVIGENDLPIAEDDSYFKTVSQLNNAGGVITAEIMDNDSDPDNQKLTIISITPIGPGGQPSTYSGDDLNNEAVYPLQNGTFTLDPDTGAKGKEPLATLATYRNVGGRILMGMNLVSDGSGTVKVGQSVEPVIDVPK